MQRGGSDVTEEETPEMPNASNSEVSCVLEYEELLFSYRKEYLQELQAD